MFFIGRNLYSDRDKYFTFTTIDKRLSFYHFDSGEIVNSPNEMDTIWQNVAFEIEYNRVDSKTTIYLYEHGFEVAKKSLDFLVLDKMDYVHLIGAEFVQEQISDYYVGFLFAIKIGSSKP